MLTRCILSWVTSFVFPASECVTLTQLRQLREYMLGYAGPAGNGVETIKLGSSSHVQRQDLTWPGLISSKGQHIAKQCASWSIPMPNSPLEVFSARFSDLQEPAEDHPGLTHARGKSPSRSAASSDPASFLINTRFSAQAVAREADAVSNDSPAAPLHLRPSGLLQEALSIQPFSLRLSSQAESGVTDHLRTRSNTGLSNTTAVSSSNRTSHNEDQQAMLSQKHSMHTGDHGSSPSSYQTAALRGDASRVSSKPRARPSVSQVASLLSGHLYTSPVATALSDSPWSASTANAGFGARNAQATLANSQAAAQSDSTPSQSSLLPLSQALSFPFQSETAVQPDVSAAVTACAAPATPATPTATSATPVATCATPAATSAIPAPTSATPVAISASAQQQGSNAVHPQQQRTGPACGERVATDSRLELLCDQLAAVLARVPATSDCPLTFQSPQLRHQQHGARHAGMFHRPYKLYVQMVTR